MSESGATGNSPRQASVLALDELLKQCLALNLRSTAIDEALGKACDSQGALAKYFNADKGIHPCSLNTMKAVADAVLAGGYAQLDQLRRQVKERLRTNLPPTTEHPSRPASLKEQLTDLQDENAALTEDVLLLDWVLARVLAQARSYVDEAGIPSLIERCKKEQREVVSMLSTRASVTGGKGAGTN